jgi:RNA-directed DNA polymerase
VRFTSFLPAISKDALKKISEEIRSWRLHRWVNSDGGEIAS